MSTTRTRRDGFFLLLLGSAIFLTLGTSLENVSPVALIDFKPLYFSARCLLHGCDPYNQSQVLRLYKAEEGQNPPGSARDREVVTRYVYFPTSFVFTIPLAVLPYGPAHLLWMALIFGALVLASFLMWNLAAESAPLLAGALVFLLLANSELQVIDGNVGAIAIGLSILAAWCFVKERHAAAGIVCLAAGLALKPQDTGLVWLYFLAAGGVYRKRALQTLAVLAALSVPVVLWVTAVSPHWMQELYTSIAALSAPGGINDPSPSSTGGHGIGMIISLQSALSFFRDDPGFYNPASYLLCAAPLLTWLYTALRSRATPTRAWLALAAIAALSLLPVYHRQGDAALLLLSVPACAMLWARGGAAARPAVLVTGAAFVLTGDLTWAVIYALIGNLHPVLHGLWVPVFIAALLFPVPFTLLAMGVFYLWVYAQGSLGAQRVAEIDAEANAGKTIAEQAE